MVSLGFNVIAVMSHGRNHVNAFFHHQWALLIHAIYLCVCYLLLRRRQCR